MEINNEDVSKEGNEDNNDDYDHSTVDDLINVAAYHTTTETIIDDAKINVDPITDEKV